MSEILDASWRMYPAAVLLLLGALLAGHGLRRMFGTQRLNARDPLSPLTHMKNFRISVIGLALLALGAGWAFGIAWLAILALIIGGEETLESSICVVGLTRGKDLRLRV